MIWSQAARQQQTFVMRRSRLAQTSRFQRYVNLQSAETAVGISSISKTQSQLQNHDETESENMFAGDAGQALLLAFKTGEGDEGEAAIIVPVFRPSI